MSAAGSALSPAPDYATIFDVESAVENAAKAILTGVSYGVPQVQTQRDLLPTNATPGVTTFPTVAVQFVLGRERLHKGQIHGGNWVSDSWDFTFGFQVQTKRPPNVGDMTHQAIRAAVMLHFQITKDEYNPNVLLYHALTYRVHSSTSLSVNAEYDIDISEILLHGVVSVRPNAWPTS